MAETPRFSTGGPITQVDVAAAIPQSQAQELRGAQEASGILTQAGQNMAARGQRLEQQAKEMFGNIETTALQLTRKAKAQDLVLEASLRSDEEIQSLLNTQGIDPLELAKRSETILDKIANETVGQAAKLGIEERDFVRQKLGTMKLHHVPSVRKTGYDRWAGERRAGLTRRNNIRKSELYKPETSQERQLELLAEIAEDIRTHTGVVLSEEQSREMLDNEKKEFFINTFFETVLVDPQAAMKIVDDPDAEFDPRQKLQLKQQAENIIQAEANKEQARLTAIEKARQKRAEKAHDLITDEIILNDRDPREFLSEPEVREVLDGKDSQNLISFYNTLQNQAKKGKVAREAATDFLNIQERVERGDMNPNDIIAYINDQADNGADISADDMKTLYKGGTSARKATLTEQKGSFESERTFAQSTLDDFFFFRPGFITLVEKDFRGQLQEAASNAKTEFRQRLRDAQEKANDLKVSPFEVVNPARVAEEMKIKYLPLAIHALKSQKFTPAAYRNMISEDSLSKSVIDFNKEMQDHVLNNRITPDNATMLKNAYRMQQEFNRLAGKVNADSERLEREKELLRGTSTSRR
jgi:hypothetical protein